MCEKCRIKNSLFWSVPHSVAIARVFTNRDRQNQEGREDEAENREQKRPKQMTDRKGRKTIESGTWVQQKGSVMLPFQRRFPPRCHHMFRFFLFHPFWVAMWVVPPIARCGIPKVQSFWNFMLLSWNHHYKGRSTKCAKKCRIKNSLFWSVPHSVAIARVFTNRDRQNQEGREDEAENREQKKPKQRTDRPDHA